MNENTRKDFLKWYKESLAQLIRCGAVEGARSFEKCTPLLELAWESSRESLVIDLPEQSPYANTLGDYAKGYRQSARDHKDAIEAAGLKVKP